MNVHHTVRALFNALTLPIILSACGGSGSDTTPAPGANTSIPTIATGRFLDSAVEGLGYESGDITGITDSQGTFQYKEINNVSQPVTFSFNGVELGTALGRAVITPLDLVPNADLETVAVQNIARFIQMFDNDGDLGNGISPSMDLMSTMLTLVWQPVNFSDNDFVNQPAVTQIIADASSVDSRVYSLPSTEQATAHLKQTLACQSSGIFSGDFSGDDAGKFVLWIQDQRIDEALFGDDSPRIGVTSAYIYSTTEDRLIGVAPQEGLQFNSGNRFVAGRASNGAEFSGNIVDFNRITEGAWQNGIEGGEGVFSGSRVAGNLDAKYRLGGAIGTPILADATADNTGAIALDVFADNRVQGVVVTSRGNRYSIAGTLNGDTVLATSEDGLTANIIFDSTGQHADNLGVGLHGQAGFWGTWQAGGNNGVLIGTSCELNP